MAVVMNMDVAPPQASISAIESFMESVYGIRGTPKELACERDQLLRYTTKNQDYIVRLSNPEEDLQGLALQVGVLGHLNKATKPVPIPHVISALNGDEISVFQLEDGRTSRVHVVTALSGEILAGMNYTTDILLARLGRYLSLIDKELGSFDHPADDPNVFWDMQGSTNLMSLAENVQEDDLRKLTCDAIQSYADNVVPALPSFMRQVIHNDMHQSNILVDPENPDNITGIIDFGDLVRGPRSQDVAVAASYHISQDEHPLRHVHTFVQAYQNVHPLEEKECALLYDMLRARMGMSIAITHWRARQFPENAKYILKNADAMQRGLFRLRDISANSATDYIFSQP